MVVVPGGDGSDPIAEPADVHRGKAIRLRPVAQLAVIVRAPALDPAAAGQRAGVVAARRDRTDPAGEPLTSTGVSAIRCACRRPAGRIVVTPALDPAAAGQRAGVVIPAAIAVTPLSSPLTSTGVSAVRRRAVAELAVTVTAPALDRAAAGQSAGVVAPDANGR